MAASPSVVRDGETGLLTAPGDAAAFADALARPPKRPRQACGALGAARRRFIRDERDLDRAAERLREALALPPLSCEESDRARPDRRHASLGAGHLTRAAALARAFAGRAMRRRWSQAADRPNPSDRSALSASCNCRRCGSSAPTSRRCSMRTGARRRRLSRASAVTLLLDDACTRPQPDIVITELFPFGRRVLADEFEALLDGARDAEPASAASSARSATFSPRRRSRSASRKPMSAIRETTIASSSTAIRSSCPWSLMARG